MGNARNVLQTIYESEFVNHTCRAGMMINPQILEISIQVCLCHDQQVKPPGMTYLQLLENPGRHKRFLFKPVFTSLS